MAVEVTSLLRNRDFAWLYVFAPAFLLYMSSLMSYLNAKPKIGSIEIVNKKFSDYLHENEQMEVIADSLGWAEGPIWIRDESCSCSYLLFSDTVKNRIYRWEEGNGLFTVGKSLYMENSGCRPSNPRCAALKEPGSNGILRSFEPLAVNLLVCEHGERSIAYIRANGTRSVLVDKFQGRRLNSPNDMAWSPSFDLLFTDPPYGLFDHSNVLRDQELKKSNVFIVLRKDVEEAMKTGIPTTKLERLDVSFTRPNGVAFSPDYSRFYVSNADPDDAYWKVFDIKADGSIAPGKVFLDVTEMRRNATFGNPDGFKVDSKGNLIASGPGGVLVISSSGELLGRFLTESAVSNVAFGDNGYLYFTASDKVLRVKTKFSPPPTYL